MNEPSHVLAEVRRLADAYDAEAAAAARALENSGAQAENDLVSVRVDGRGRVVDLEFSKRVKASSVTRLAAAVLEAYVDASAAASSACSAALESVVAQTFSAGSAADDDVALDPDADGLDGPEFELGPYPSQIELAAFDHRIRQYVDEFVFAARDRADRIEQVTATAESRFVSVTLTGSGRLRRVGFRPQALALEPAALAADVLVMVETALAEASSEAARLC